MKKIDIKEIPLAIIVINGVIASLLSFGYYFVLDNPSDVICWMIYTVDLLLFAVSAYRVVESFDLSKVKTSIFTALTMLFFVAFCEIVVFAFTVDTNVQHTLALFFDVLRVAVFLSPSLILLIPIVIFIAGLMG